VKEALNRIYNMDCLEGMEQFLNKYGEGCIDMILCDLPYGTTRNKWDSLIDLDKLWGLYKRLIKSNGVIVLTAQTPFDKVLGVSNLEWLKYEWIWEKAKATGHLNAKKMPMKAHENVLVFYNELPSYTPQKTEGKPYKPNGGKSKEDNYGRFDSVREGSEDGSRYPRSVLYFPQVKGDSGLHPTQKPVALFEYLIKTYTNEGGIVLDNCMGSGTSAIACMNTNRNFIGFELDKQYYEIANERIGNHLKEMTG
jgi:site-specific DNA-methyltransferase (adenine-specific)